MLLLEPTSNAQPHAARRLAYTVAYVLLMVAGTAVLILAFSRHDDTRMLGADGQPVTAAEVVMQSAAERALVSPKTAVLAGNLELKSN